MVQFIYTHCGPVGFVYIYIRIHPGLLQQKKLPQNILVRLRASHNNIIEVDFVYTCH